jgi:hypothetical protein
MGKKLLGGAASAAAVAADVARHVVWYFAYRVDGKARESSTERDTREHLSAER